MTFPLFQSRIEGLISPTGRQSAILAKTQFANRFQALPRDRTRPEIRLGGRGFQKIKEALRQTGEFEASSTSVAAVLCNAQFVPFRGLRGLLSPTLPHPACRPVSHKDCGRAYLRKNTVRTPVNDSKFHPRCLRNAMTGASVCRFVKTARIDYVINDNVPRGIRAFVRE
jgi:hypothetical protein